LFRAEFTRVLFGHALIIAFCPSAWRKISAKLRAHGRVHLVLELNISQLLCDIPLRIDLFLHQLFLALLLPVIDQSDLALSVLIELVQLESIRKGGSHGLQEP
jgi:hypothetical protein